MIRSGMVSCWKTRINGGLTCMIPDSRASLPTWVTDLQSAGRVTFTSDEAKQELGVNHGAFLDSAERLQRKGHLLSPRRGFYVIVPPQHLSWGAPPPSWYIDELMQFERSPYYVGLLKAAELHGAAHQAVMEFQVVTSKRLPQIQAGRSILAFYFRKDMPSAADAVVPFKTDSGQMNVSSPELTALDLLRYPQAAGGIDNVATVFAEIADRLDADRLSSVAQHCERSVAQRVGHLLDHLGHTDRTSPLHAVLSQSNLSWVELDTTEAKDADFAREPLARDEKWRIVVRRQPEVDQ